MYEYVDGKTDWMAWGLPVEGDGGPYAGGALVDVATCAPADTATDVRARLEASGDQHAVVVTEDRIVLGAVTLDSLAGAAPDEPVFDVMELSPSTIRPHVPLSNLDERSAGALVTTPTGKLLGAVDPDAVAGTGHNHDHDHEHEHPDAEGIESELHEVLAAVEERFGDREPDQEELRDFLRERLVAKGRTAEEADEVMADMDDKSSEG